jgi:serine/threonine-protein kinase
MDFALLLLLLGLGVGYAARALLAGHVKRTVRRGEVPPIELEILSDLGTGATSDLYEARHPLLACPVALEVARLSRDRGAARRRFESGLVAAARFEHAGLVRVLDLGETLDEKPYSVMELIDGLTVAELVARNGPLPDARAVHLARQIAQALGYLHDQGFAHRDLKPSNVMALRTSFDTIKVIDFDLLARCVASTRAAPQSSESAFERALGTAGDPVAVAVPLVGTPHYLAPEVIRDPERVQPAQDVYSLGGVMYFMLTGSEPFRAQGPREALERQLDGVLEPPSVRRGRPLARDLEALVLECLAKDPARRPRDGNRVAERLAVCGDADSWTQTEAATWWATRGTPAPREARVARRCVVKSKLGKGGLDP